jgi:hypothetical protein
VVNGISHHENVIEELQYLKEQGIERFVEEREKQGRCPTCRKKLYWYLHECPRCHTFIERNGTDEILKKRARIGTEMWNLLAPKHQRCLKSF